MSKIENFEQAGEVGNIDSSQNYFDPLTTVNGLLRKYAQENLYREDTISGIRRFPGIVLYKDETGNTSDYDVSLMSDLTADTKIVSYRVRVPALHGMLPVPNNYGPNASEKDKKIIELYPNFTGDPEMVRAAPGDFVYVIFKDLKNFSGGEIVGNIDGTLAPAANGTSNLGESKEQLSDNFNNLPAANIKGKKILYLGDSHTFNDGGLGGTLEALINKNNTCIRVAKGGRQAGSFLSAYNGGETAKGWKIGKNEKVQMEQVRSMMRDTYDVYIVSLGTNEIVSHGGSMGTLTKIQLPNTIKLLKTIQKGDTSKKVFLIGPASLPFSCNGLDLKSNYDQYWVMASKEDSEQVRNQKAQKYKETCESISKTDGSITYLKEYIVKTREACKANGFYYIDSYPITKPFTDANPNRHDVHFYYKDKKTGKVEGAIWAEKCWDQISRIIGN